jgi:diguanylate cyclase (GGDEF)-like protein
VAIEKAKKESGSRPSGVLDRASDPSLVSTKDAEAAVDTLGAVLRAFGAAAFDIAELDAAEVRRLFEKWAEHVLIAAPLDPGSLANEGQRQWGAVRQLVAAHRKREATHVASTIDNLREAIWSFVESVNRATSQDKQEGVLARERLSSLRSALEGKDIETLRREVSTTANLIENALADQQRRQEQRLAEFAANVRSLGQQLEGARRESSLDPLTRLPNRAAFDDFVARTAKLAALLGRSVALMMIDVDQFKKINDMWGHPAGDATIKSTADCLTRTFPRRGDLVARFGGDEFAVVLRDVAPSDARALAQRLVEAVRGKKLVYSNREISVTASVGLAFFAEGDTPERWLARADAALYAAKAAGRDGWAEAPANGD